MQATAGADACAHAVVGDEDDFAAIAFAGGADDKVGRVMFH